MLDHRIDTFLTLCEVMNYRETAQMLHITQPAVTQHIQFLEREYECQLFTYENRRLTKTRAAMMLEEYARSMKYNEETLREKLRKGPIRELKIGATKTIGDYVIADQVHRYLRREDCTLILVVDNTEHLLKLLEENQLDFAIIEGYFDKNRYDFQLLRKEPFVGICRKDHPFAGREIGLNELLAETIVHREAGSGTRAILEQRLRSENETLEHFKRQICISSFKLILDLVGEGFGVSFVYNVLADSAPELAKFNLQGEPIVREFNLVYLKHTNAQEKIDMFFA